MYRRFKARTLDVLDWILGEFRQELRKRVGNAHRNKYHLHQIRPSGEVDGFFHSGTGLRSVDFLLQQFL